MANIQQKDAQIQQNEAEFRQARVELQQKDAELNSVQKSLQVPCILRHSRDHYAYNAKYIFYTCIHTESTC